MLHDQWTEVIETANVASGFGAEGGIVSCTGGTINALTREAAIL
jgi:hypothetical protein